MMARLMLDYDGDVAVSEDGGIFYRFAEMRKTASESSNEASPSAAWEREPKPLPPADGELAGREHRDRSPSTGSTC